MRGAWASFTVVTPIWNCRPLLCRAAFIRMGVRLIGLTVSAAFVTGCAAGAYRQGELAARRGDWDAVVEHYQRALEDDSQRADYRIAFERARRNASWDHFDTGREFEARDDLVAARAEYKQATVYDPSNSQTIDRLAAIDREIRDRVEASILGSPAETPAGLAELLDPSSRQPLRVQFSDASLRDILDFIGNATGINVIYDQQFQDRSYSVDLDGVTIEEALDLILTANGYFYQVLRPRSIIVARP